MQRADDNESAGMNAKLDQLRSSESIAGRAMPSVPIDSDDGAERWGRRIGRTLGWLAAAFLLYQFYQAYFA